jgi:iron complex transport system substrate-binding protein
MPTLGRRLLAAFGLILVATAAEAHVQPRTLGAYGSDAADGVFPRVVRHLQGETMVPAAPKRVVAIATGQLDGLLTLGIVPAGAARVDGSALYPAYLAQQFPDLRPRMDAIADLGTRTVQDVEAIAELHPDLILMNNAVNRAEQYQRLSQIAPTVVTQGTGLNWKIDFLLVASAVGRRQQAQAFLDRFHADADRIAARWQGRPPTVSFLMATAGRMRIFGVPSFAGGIAEDMGLARPASQQFQATSRDISPELLDQADADWLFYAARGGALTGAPLWPTLDAVASRHAVPVDLDGFYLNAGPTAARSVLDTLAAAVRR